MKSYHFSFVSYKDKVRSLPGWIGFIVILFLILLIPLLFCLVIAVGLVFVIISGILGLIFPSRKKRNASGKIHEADVSYYNTIEEQGQWKKRTFL